MNRVATIVLVLLAACGPADRQGANTGVDGSVTGDGTGSGQPGCSGLANCYSVYAHSDSVLYVVDLQAKTLSTVGNFNAPETITDLAVAPDNTIYVVSETAIYTASATTGHATKVGTLAACGSRAVALTTLPNGEIWAGDFKGAVCQIDITTTPPTVKPPITLSGGLALSGDLVAVADGTVYGTAYKLSDGANMGTQANNLLVKIDLTTGTTTPIGASGFPSLFGASFAEGGVIGFTHDGSGRVVKMDPTTGAGTLFATFMDPSTGKPITFAGAGVNSLVPVIQ